MDYNEVTASPVIMPLSTYSTLNQPERKVLSVKQKIEEWFIEPALSFDERNGFAILLIILPLYEAHLRAIGVVTELHFLSDSNSGPRLKADFGFQTEAQAKEFWAALRNGLIHRIAPQPPKGGHTLHVALVSFGPAIRVDGPICYVSACALREIVIQLVRREVMDWDETRISFTCEVWCLPSQG